jgi:hypothetical protein
MRKYFYPIIFLALVFLISFPKLVSASDIDWKLQWQDNGIIHEEVRMLNQEIKLGDSSWQRSQEGDYYIFQRDTENWSKYQDLPDKLPLQANQSNYFVFKKTEIKFNGQNNEIFKQLVRSNTFVLTISVPGIIIGSSADQVKESVATWELSKNIELFQQKSLIKYITVDGLILGIEILLLGLLIIIIKFIRHLKKVEKIIEEEYSITNINNDNKKNDG